MKRKIFILLIVFMSILTTGCLKWDNMEDISIITTIYPIEYVTNYLYGNSSKISVIYPRGADVSTFEITDKRINDFSKSDLFIYNGNSNEKEYATSMLSNNKNLKIIDASKGAVITYSDYDLWLNPSNILMVAQNVRNELEQYISSNYIIEEINDRYQMLKVNITELETEFKKTADNSNDLRIITSDESLKFLEKYGFTIINLTEKGERKENNISLAQTLLGKKLDYVFIHENDANMKLVDEVINGTKAKKLTFRILETITSEDINNGDDYISLMHQNLELLKKETYK